MLLHRISIEYIIDDNGEPYIDCYAEGDTPFVTALGMLEFARQEIYEEMSEAEDI
ncbi:MAG: hypothetical protein PUJ86_09480 [Mycobacteriaceae bacterium]|nr:hypothetical protein [Mycobacteriaceae bacterium]